MTGTISNVMSFQLSEMDLKNLTNDTLMKLLPLSTNGYQLINELQNKLTEIYTKQLRKARTICQDL